MINVLNAVKTPTILFAIAFLLAKLLKPKKNGRNRLPYPPGPKGLPLLGNVFDFPTSSPWEAYCDWGKIYNSDILYGSALGNRVLILNNRDDADELLEKRSQRYSGRPRIPIVQLMGWDFNVGLLDYGESWRYHRKICHQTFHPDAAKFYYPIQTRKVHQMLGGLLLTPADFEAHSKMLSIGTLMAMMYGYDVKSLNDPFIEVAEKGQRLGNGLLVPGATLLNVFPILCRIPPIAGPQKLAAQVRKLTEAMQKLPMDFAKKAMHTGTAKASLVTSFLEKQESGPAAEREERALEMIAATVYSAGSDTTIAATNTFFYGMTINPEIQRRAQVEIDSVIGSDRLPEYNDRHALPVTEAIYREILRWRPPGPLGVPHLTTQDDVYKGYFIPKGTAVFTNIWAMTHDERNYPDGFKFHPERFLTPDGQLNDDNKILAYGFGRRVCVGRHVAGATLWLLIASVLATFDITQAKDEFGKEIEVEEGYTDGMISQKKSFKCSIIPRSTKAQELVENSASKARSQ